MNTPLIRALIVVALILVIFLLLEALGVRIIL